MIMTVEASKLSAPTLFSLRFIIVAMTLATMMGVAVPATAQSNTAKVERGKYLVDGIGGCGDCHTPRGGPLKGATLAGGSSFGGPKAPFEAHASNLTPDPETGIGKWTDEQIVKAIREGVRPDGSVIGPPMATEFFKHISDSDAGAIVAYLRTVKPVKNRVKKSVYRIPLRPGEPAGKVADIPRSDKVKFGAYLVTIGHCMECHSPMVKGRVDYHKQMGAGGRKFPGPWGMNIARNITQDKETGIGAYTDAQIKVAIAKGVKADGVRMRPPMCFGCYAKMSDGDLDAMIAFLRTVKPIKNDVYR
jgi:mono/diheme cytochrome c family protein